MKKTADRTAEDAIYKKIYKDRDALAEILSSDKEGPRPLVFTNGCFDILHRGHVSYLARARSLGRTLVVGLNSDDSVRRLKGQGRPIQKWEDRAFVLAGLFCVDYVLCFEEDTPKESLAILQPEIHCKGGDYKPEDLPEKAVVDSYGGRIVILDFVLGHSTSSILERSR